MKDTALQCSCYNNYIGGDNMVFRLADSLGFQLNKTNTKLKQELGQQLRPYDITPEQWATLNCLWECEGITPKDIADRICKDKPNTNRILEKLEAKALIERRAHPDDKRAYQVFLTEEGRALRLVLIPLVEALLSRVLEGLTQEQIAVMKQCLAHVYQQLT